MASYNLAGLQENVLTLKHIRGKLKAEQRRANKIKAKEKLEQKDRTKLAGIRAIVDAFGGDVDEEAKKAAADFSAISRHLEREKISLTRSERTTILRLKQQIAELKTECKQIVTDVLKS